MKRLLVILLLLLFIILAVFAVRNKAPEIQSDIGNKASAILKNEGADQVSAEASGRSVHLVGRVLGKDGSQNDINSLVSKVESAQGGLSVSHDLEAIRLASPYRLAATKDTDGLIKVSGYVVDEAEKTKVISETNAFFSAKDTNVTYDLEIAEGKPDHLWTDLAIKSFASLDNLNEGAVELSDRTLIHSGVAEDNTARNATLSDSLGGFPDGYTSKDLVKVLPPFVSPYEFSATKTEAGQLILDGVVPSQKANDDLVASAKETFRNQPIQNRLSVARGAPEVDWAKTSMVGIKSLHSLSSGRFLLSDNAAYLTGKAADNSALEMAVANLDVELPTSFRHTAEIEVSPTVVGETSFLLTNEDNLISQEIKTAEVIMPIATYEANFSGASETKTAGSLDVVTAEVVKPIATYEANFSGASETKAAGSLDVVTAEVIKPIATYEANFSGTSETKATGSLDVVTAEVIKPIATYEANFSGATENKATGSLDVVTAEVKPPLIDPGVNPTLDTFTFSVPVPTKTYQADFSGNTEAKAAGSLDVVTAEVMKPVATYEANFSGASEAKTVGSLDVVTAEVIKPVATYEANFSGASEAKTVGSLDVVTAEVIKPVATYEANFSGASEAKTVGSLDVVTAEVIKPVATYEANFSGASEAKTVGSLDVVTAEVIKPVATYEANFSGASEAKTVGSLDVVTAEVIKPVATYEANFSGASEAKTVGSLDVVTAEVIKPVATYEANFSGASEAKTVGSLDVVTAEVIKPVATYEANFSGASEAKTVGSLDVVTAEVKPPLVDPGVNQTLEVFTLKLPVPARTYQADFSGTTKDKNLGSLDVVTAEVTSSQISQPVATYQADFSGVSETKPNGSFQVETIAIPKPIEVKAPEHCFSLGRYEGAKLVTMSGYQHNAEDVAGITSYAEAIFEGKVHSTLTVGGELPTSLHIAKTLSLIDQFESAGAGKATLCTDKSVIYISKLYEGVDRDKLETKILGTEYPSLVLTLPEKTEPKQVVEAVAKSIVEPTPKPVGTVISEPKPVTAPEVKPVQPVKSDQTKETGTVKPEIKPVSSTRVSEDQYCFVIRQSPDNKIDLNGYQETEFRVNRINSYAKSKLGKLTSTIAVGGKAYNRGWLARSYALIDEFKVSKQGWASICSNSTDIHIRELKEGIDAREVRENLESKQFRNLSLTLPAPLPAPKPIVTASLCNGSLSALTDQSRISFEVGEANLTPDSVIYIQSLVETILPCIDEGLVLEVGGHTDTRGSASMNKNLSQARANSVANVLRGENLSSDQVKGIGYGEEFPLNDEKTPEELAENRRVEFVFK